MNNGSCFVCITSKFFATIVIYPLVISCLVLEFIFSDPFLPIVSIMVASSHGTNLSNRFEVVKSYLIPFALAS